MVCVTAHAIKHTGTLKQRRCLNCYSTYHFAGAAGVAPQRRPRGPRGASKMTIGVKLQTDKTVWLEVRPGTIIKDVKGMLQDREGVPPDQQRYVFGGKQLLDDTSMLECGVKGGGVMHMVLRLRGC
jgi:ubiquitin-large subunit ribosomal protein L40e